VQQSAYLNQHAGRLAQLAICLLSLVHQADSLTLWQCPVSLSQSGQWAGQSALSALAV